MSSILNETKVSIGINQDDTSFDLDIIPLINGCLMVLNQNGVGPSGGLVISDSTTGWDALVGDRKDLEMVKTYITLKVRILFDPPTSSYVLEAFKENINEALWRIREQIEVTQEVLTP